VIVIGITGGIASGKSLVTTMFRDLGIPVIDTDEIARQVVAPGQPAWQRLREIFGAAYFHPDRTLDRAALAQRVFTNPTDRLLLESITHPAIFTEVERQLADLRCSSSPPPLVAIAIPLLFEVEAEARVDRIVVVDATPAQQRDRLQRLRGYTAAEADARIAAQMPLAEKVRRADAVIDNRGAIIATRAQVVDLVAALLREVKT